jgi:hypothetical protein
VCVFTIHICEWLVERAAIANAQVANLKCRARKCAVAKAQLYLCPLCCTARNFHHTFLHVQGYEETMEMVSHTAILLLPLTTRVLLYACTAAALTIAMPL